MPSTLQVCLTVEIIWNDFTFFHWNQELVFRALPGGTGVHQISRRIVIQPRAYPTFAVYDLAPDPVGPRVPVHLTPNAAVQRRFATEIDV